MAGAQAALGRRVNAPVLHARDGRLYLPATANYSVCKQMFVSERRERSVDTVDLELDRLISRRASTDHRTSADELRRAREPPPAGGNGH